MATLTSAAGFGASTSAAVLGQPLAFNVAFRVDANDPLTAACVQAEVTLGDRRVPASEVHIRVDMQRNDVARVRVLTDRPVDEPVVVVVLNAGCTARQTRRFVLFADPPASVAGLPVVTVAAATPAAPMPAGNTETPRRDAAVADTVSPAATIAAPTRSTTRSLRADRRPSAAPRRAASQPAGLAPMAPAAASTATNPSPSLAATAAAATASAMAAVAAATAAQPAATTKGPRLQLDVAESAPDLIDAALAAVAEAASATRAANAAAAVAASRIAALERDVDRLRSDVRNNQADAAGWQSRLADAESSSRWLWPLILLTLLLAALASWLSWRLSAAQRQRQVPWQAAAAEHRADGGSAGGPSAPMPFVIGSVQAAKRSHGSPAWPPPVAAETLPPDAAERDTVSLHAIEAPVPRMSLDMDSRTDEAAMRGGPPPHSRSRDAANAADPVVSFAAAAPTSRAAARSVTQPSEPASERTQPYVPPWTSDDSAPRDVSIEELIDLEQQAEFFVVLGQDDAAVDLLVDHLRQTGGGSPLPYLKLLEIYHRRGDREEYERTRTRFNHRFNAYAPEWDVGLTSGRSLDDYAGIVPRLQQAWSRPLDAMAELEALLFRKSRGELFDLPAYREVLFLYSLSRDLLDREAADTGSVDLLLPISEGSVVDSSAVAPYLTLTRDERDEWDGRDGREDHDGHDPDDIVTLPVDLDLSNPATRPSSIFDALHDTLKKTR